MKKPIKLSFLLVGLLFIILVISILILSRQYQIDTGQVENIDGLPFPLIHDTVVITEKLAHTDIYLNQTRFAKQATITVTFSPQSITDLSLGIRRDPFWLSYDKLSLCCSRQELTQPDTPITKTVNIPLTDKWQDHDQSLDLMFFATNPSSTSSEDEGIADQTLWHLHGLSIVSSSIKPTSPAIKDFLKSLLSDIELL